MQHCEHVIDYFDAQLVRWGIHTEMGASYSRRGVRYAELAAGYRDHNMNETLARRRELYGPNYSA